MRAIIIVCLTLAAPAPAFAQSAWSYRARVAAETTSSQANGASPLTRASTASWRTRQLFLASGDAAWTPSDRARVGGALAGIASEHGNFDGRVREIYARASAASWLDLEAGKRIVRWGVGYGFAPAGVLDPPRVATDPSDRLQLNEGRWLARGDVYRGESSLTVAGGENLAAARFSTVARGGVEIGLIAAAGRDRHPQYAATMTHVVGDRFEWHGEALLHDDEGARVVSAAAGFQYTFAAGVNLIVEYHRNGLGMNSAEWSAALSGRRAPGERPARDNFLFLRAARTGANDKVSPEVIVIAGIDDNSWTVLPSVTWTAHRHVQMHIRATHLAGARRSIARAAPFSTLVTAGAVLRF